MSFCKTVSGSFIFFQILHAIIFNTLLLSFVRKTTEKVFSVLLILFLTNWHTFNFEILRESLAVAFFLHALLALKEKRYIKYVLWAVVGSLFHMFAFVIFVIVPVLCFLPSKYTFPTLVVFSLFALRFASFFNSAMAFVFVESTARFMSDDVVSKLEAYTLGGNREGFITLNLLGLTEVLILQILLPLIILIRLYKMKVDKIFISCIVLFILFSILQTNILIVYRFKNYCLIPLLVCMVNVLYDRAFRKNMLRLAYVTLLGIYVLWGAYNFYRPDERLSPGGHVKYDTRYFPYKSVFDKP